MAPLPSTFHITQVVQEFSRAGGVETVAYELHRNWEAAGIACDILAATIAPDVDPAVPVRFALPPGLSNRIPTRGRWRYLGRSALVPSFTLAATAALRLGRRRGGWAENAVILSHGDSLVADVIVLHAINAASLAQKRRDGQWRWALNPMHLWVKGRDRVMLSGQRARRYVAVSRRVRDELVDYHHVSPDRIVVIPNGTDLDRYTPDGPGAGLRAQFGIPEASPLLLFVGHEFARKGLSFLIASLTQPGCGEAHVVAVGDGDAAAYASLAEASGVGDRVHFTGPRSDMPTLYRDADAFVFPTAYETFSLVCLEAMACGVPVFATPVGGVEDYLQDGHNGRVISRDGSAIAGVLGPLLADKTALHRLGQGARATALDYSWQHVATRYSEMLKEVWGEKYATSRPPSA